MDLYDHHRGQSSAHKRNQAAQQFNTQLDVIGRQQAAASRAAAASKEQQAEAIGIQSETKDAIVGAFAVKGGIQDMSAALKGKGTIADVAKDALKNAKGAKSLAEAGGKVSDSVLGEETSGKLKEGAKKSGLTGKIEKFGATKAGAKIGKATEAAMGHTGALVNIGMGAYDVAEDFKGGKFQLKGDNDAEKTANALQIGAGVADAIGFVFPPAFVLGAALGVASQVADVIGSGQEATDKETKIAGDEKAQETKDQASIQADKIQIEQSVVDTTTALAAA
tara:strand:+ start:439 stop:1275 length:837 start_codon:yes stop_codon:yes gene_type:complete